MGTIATAAGCSTTAGLGNWFGGGDAKSAKAGSVYFAAVDGLPVMDAPKAGARVVGTLRLHQKVTRSTVENGYAKVKASTGGLEGWVLNAKLIWRLPSAPVSSRAGGDAPAPAQDGSEPPATADGAADLPADAAADPAGDVAAKDGAVEADTTAADAPAADATPPAAPAAKPARKPRSGASVFDPY